MVTANILNYFYFYIIVIYCEKKLLINYNFILLINVIDTQSYYQSITHKTIVAKYDMKSRD